MQRLGGNLTENQQKMAIMAGALLMGATSVYYISKKTFGKRVRYEEPDLSAVLP